MMARFKDRSYMDISSSEDSSPSDCDQRNCPLGRMTVCVEQSSSRLSSAPSCISLQSNSSVPFYIDFRNNYSDGSSSGQRPGIHCVGCQKRRGCSSHPAHLCICGTRGRAKTHRCMHPQTCLCCGDGISPSCTAGTQNHGKALAQCADELMNHYSPGGEKYPASWFWTLGPLLGILFITAFIMFFMTSYQMQELKTSQALKIMMLGRSGAGKSASGNTILGRQAFDDRFSFSPVTKSCKTHSAVVSGWKVEITDTPELLHLQSKNCYSEESAANVFLLVIRLGRITDEERDSVRYISELFSPGVLNHTLVLFTGGDFLGKKPISQLLAHGPPVVKELVSVCGGGYHVFNNKDMTDSRQVEELLMKIEAIMNLNIVYTIQANNVNSVKHVTGEKQTLCIFFVICVVLLVVDLTRVFLCAFLVLVAKKVDVYVTRVLEHSSRPMQITSGHGVSKDYITDDMKEAEIKHAKKEKTEPNGRKY